jgi:predicted SAM-dependent methyltransferase
LIDKYQNGWQYQKWLENTDYKFITSAGMMINYAVRAWGHKYIWNKPDLWTILQQAGFDCITDYYKLNNSIHDELCNLETREDSTLIMEALK